MNKSPLMAVLPLMVYIPQSPEEKKVQDVQRGQKDFKHLLGIRKFAMENMSLSNIRNYIKSHQTQVER